MVNHGRKSRTHQNLLYETWPMREFGGRIWPNKDFNQMRNFDYHNGLDRNLNSIKLKIIAFRGKNDIYNRKRRWNLYLIAIDIQLVKFTNYIFIWWD
jgi:hypothetical protein